MADRGSYFVTTLNRTKRKRKRKRKRKKKKEKKRKLNQKKKKKYIQCYSCNNIASSFRLFSKKDMNWNRVSFPRFQPLLNLLQFYSYKGCDILF